MARRPSRGKAIRVAVISAAFTLWLAIAMFVRSPRREEPSPGFRVGASTKPEANGSAVDCVCPQTTSCDADIQREQLCLEYLSNWSNVNRVVPMKSNLRFGRTAKLRVHFNDPCVTAVAKLPQALFPLEPYAEYTAFEIDRMLHLRYVPPTTWLFIPVSTIEAAAAHFANVPQWKLVENIHDNTTHDYAKWISEEVLSTPCVRDLSSLSHVLERCRLAAVFSCFSLAGFGLPTVRHFACLTPIYTFFDLHRFFTVLWPRKRRLCP